MENGSTKQKALVSLKEKTQKKTCLFTRLKLREISEMETK